jgi:membrane protease YdiL (CAAX protease family)
VEHSAPARRFPVAAVALILGGVLFTGGVVLLLALRGQPLETRSPILQALPLAAVVAGGLVVCAGLAIVLLGWGNGSRRAPPPVGSHRSILVSTGLAIIAALTVTILSIAAFPAVAPESTGLFLFVAGVMDVSLLAVFYFQGVRRGLITTSLLGLRPQNLDKALKWGLGGAGALLLLSVAASAVLAVFGVRQPQGEWLGWLRDLPGPQLVLVLVAGVLAAPIAEELFFRGYVFNAYLAEKGTLTAYVSSALIFGLVHGHVALLLAIFPMGLVLAYLYRRSGTILAPMVAHAVNNGFAFAALLGTRQ